MSRSEVVDTEVCQGFTTYKVKAALSNINPTKAAGPDKIHPLFLHKLGPVSISLLTRIFNIFVCGDQSPSRMESSRHQTNTKRREGHREDGEL